MLLLDAPSDAAGLAVFADHLSSTTFHYLPGLPRVVRSAGRPSLQLLRYRAPNAGGLLLLEVDLSHDPATFEAGRADLVRRYGAADLVPVTFREGTVRLVALGTDSSAPPGGAQESRTFLVERVMGSTTPALFGAGRAIFNVQLSGEGASLVHRALQDSSLPLAIVYELTFEGLHRARGARASMEFAMAYDFLHTKLQAGALIFKGDLDNEVEALRRAGLVSITDVDYTGTDPATLAARADELRKELATLVEATFFRQSVSPATLAGPAVAAGTAEGDAWARGGHGHAAFVLRELSQRETGTLTYDLTVSRVARRTIAPQGALTALAGADVAILDIDADSPGARSITVVVPPGADWSGVEAVEATFEQDTAPLGTIVVSPSRTEGTIAAPPGAARYSTRVLARPEPDGLGQAFSDASATQPLLADHLIIDPGALSGRRVVSIALDRTEPGSRVTARGALESEGRSRPFALDAARPIVAIPVWGSQPLDWACAVELDRAVVASDRRAVLPSERLLVVSLPPGRHQFVTVELADPMDRLECVFVEMEDGAARRSLVKVDSMAPRATWSGVRKPDAPAPFRWSARAVTKTGRSVETGWRDGAGSLLVVGDTDVLIRLVEIFIISAPPSSIGAELLMTTLAPPQDIDGRISVVLEPPFHTSIRLPFRRDSLSRTYRVEGRLFLEDGESSLGPVESSDEVCLIGVQELP